MTMDDDVPYHQHIISGWRFKMVFIIVLISIIGYFCFSVWAGWDHVTEAISQVGVIGICVACSLSLFNYGLRFIRWQLFLGSLGHSIPWIKSLRIYMSGFALTTTPGKTGEAIRGVFLKDLGVPFRHALGAFFSERVSDLMAVSILASTGLWIYPNARPILLIVAIMFGLILFVIQKDAWLMYIEKCAERYLPIRCAHFVKYCLEIVLSFRNCFKGRTLFIAIILGVIAWSFEGLALYYICHLLHYEITFLTSLFIYGFSLVIGGITLSPGGLGGAEFTMLQMLMLNDIPASTAVAITIVIRLTSLWFSVFLGFLCLPRKQIFKN